MHHTSQGAPRSFAEGIVWPAETSRRIGIVLATVLIKLSGARASRRVPCLAGFTIGAVFALGLLGVPEEQALAMALIVQGASLLTVAGIGALALWWQGVALTELRAAGGGDRAPCD
jgi:hypothetical protein